MRQFLAESVIGHHKGDGPTPSTGHDVNTLDLYSGYVKAKSKKASSLLVEALEHEGVEYVFGVPGKVFRTSLLVHSVSHSLCCAQAKKTWIFLSLFVKALKSM